MNQARLFCAVCGSPDIIIGYGDGDYLCLGCDDWRDIFVKRERQRIAHDHEAKAWIDAWRGSLAGYQTTFPAERRRIFS